MERPSRIGLPLMVVCVALTGCVTVPRNRDTEKIDELMVARGAPVPAWPAATLQSDLDDVRLAELLNQPLTVERAVQLAFLKNPRIRSEYARLGITQADLYEASRLSNPTFGFIDLRPTNGENHQITRSVSLNFADVLLLRARTRLAHAEVERVRHEVAAALIELATRVETAWYEYVSTKQVAAMREAVAQASANSAEFAQRSHEAGNLTPRDLALELAAASEARITAARAAADTVRFRTALANVLGVSSREKWDTPSKLAAPLDNDATPDALIAHALEARLDLQAARREVNLLEDALGVTRRWRYLGAVDVGYERESETDGARVRGPSLALQLPIFNTGRGAVLRARAQLEESQARFSAIELAVRNEVASGLDRMSAAREIAERYRTALVPQREAVVQREMERYNFMLAGIFELLQARRAEFDAYQEYLEAVRDYWVARAELRREAGGKLPGDEHKPEATIGIEDVLTPSKETMEEMDHSEMDHSKMNHDTSLPDKSKTPVEETPPEQNEQHHHHGSQLQSRSTEGEQP